jgi:hypothetical protein
MPTTVLTSVASRFRIERARAWLENKDTAEEVLILAASLSAANEIARSIAKVKGAAFGWHRLTLAQLAVNIALPDTRQRRCIDAPGEAAHDDNPKIGQLTR